MEGRSYRFSGKAILNALLQDADPNSAKTTSAPKKKKTSGTWRRWARYLSATGLVLVGIFFLVGSLQSVSDNVRLQELKAAADVAGLRRLNRETAVVSDVRAKEDFEAESAEIREALGIPDLTFQYGDLTHLEYPLQGQIAKAISQIETEVILAHSLDDLVAVFPGSQTWVLRTKKGLASIRLGSLLKLEEGVGHSGLVTNVSMNRLELKTDRGPIQFLERPAYELFGQSERDEVQTVIYPEENGNLVPLLKWVATELGGTYESQVVQSGQVVGFFPPYAGLDGFLADLTSIGVKWADQVLTLESRPQPKLYIGSFRMTIYLSGTLNSLFARFDQLLPQDLQWAPFGDRSYLYSGQQLITVLNQFNLYSAYQNNQLVLLREKVQ